jgi:two-component system, NarL family, nitrate/nitrite response regulator NarL
MLRPEIRKLQRVSAVTVLRRRNVRQSRNSGKKIDILIADREAIFRVGLCRILGLEATLRVVGETEEPVETLHKARQVKPDLIFLQADFIAQEKDADLPKRLHNASPGCKVVVTAASIGDREHVRYIKAGASGVIVRSADPELFVKCAHKVMLGEVWLAKAQVAEIAHQIREAPIPITRPADTLTTREKTIISCLVQGLRNREIAEQLDISEQTVKNHLHAVYDKVGVSDRLELVLYVLHQRIALPPLTARAVNQN